MSPNIKIDEDWLFRPAIMCGVMTGTSIDGIDAAIVEFWLDASENHKFRLIQHVSMPFPVDLKDLIHQIISGKGNIEDAAHVHYYLSGSYADAIRLACETASLSISDLDGVGIHGQTVWHRGFSDVSKKYQQPVTLQLGSPSALAQMLGITVVGDFRAADVALGGHGAPLVPIFDYEFLRDSMSDVVVLNIGGIANISVLPAKAKKTEVKAFDTGPGNMLVDMAMQHFFDLPYDIDGKTAGSGHISNEMLDDLKSLPFTRTKPPKTTGREMFGYDFFESIIEKHELSINLKRDIVSTFAAFTSWSIAENIRLFAPSKPLIIASGGGVFNKFIMEQLKQELPDLEIITSDRYYIPPTAKEAMCFAYLAYRTLCGLPSNMPSVTGAVREAVLGVVAYP